jgi:hypothetical protein
MGRPGGQFPKAGDSIFFLFKKVNSAKSGCHLKIKSGLFFDDLKIKSGLKRPDKVKTSV